MNNIRQFVEDQLVIATHNKGKLREIKALFENFRFYLISADSLGLAEPEETEKSFQGNALLKARAAAAATNLPALADDSGLVIDEYLVENRLERGISYFKESGINMLPENTRVFIDFVVNDIMKDAAEHIERLKTDEKTIKKAITKQTGAWFNKYLERME